MQKSIIIAGPKKSGKTTLAKELASSYKEEEVVYITCKKTSALDIIAKCTKTTKLIVWDEARAYFDTALLNFLVSETIYYDSSSGSYRDRIPPRLIVVIRRDFSNDDIGKYDSSFWRRFELFRLTNKS